MSETLTLSEAAQAVLIPFNFDGSAEPGHRRLRRAAVSSSSDESTWDELIDIPIYLHSLQSLRFVGFKKAAAEVILERYHSALIRHANIPMEFYDFMTGFLEGRPENAYRADHDWDKVLKDLGIRERVRMGILNPDYDHLRLTKSAKDWALITIEDGWIFLTGMDKAVKRNGKKIKKAFSKDGPGARAKRRSEIGSEAEQQTGSLVHPTTTASSTIIEDNNNIVLYKGGTVPRFEEAFSSDGELLLWALISAPPTDFSSTSSFLYFSKQYQCAFEYAGYAHSRHPEQDAGIFKISVPKELLADSREIFDEEWKELVFACRSPKKLARSGLETQLKYDEENLLIGPICGISNEQCKRLNEASELKPLTLKTGVKASQDVIKSVKRITDIGEACQGRAMIEVTKEKIKMEVKETKKVLEE
jgi:hypothetical protein